MTLRAVDFNHWKTVSSWPALAAAVDAIILKATQYTTYLDPTFAANLAAARRTGKPLGVYHFVGRNGMQTAKLPPGDPAAEANWFLSKYAHQPGEMIIVDWEPDALPADPDGWLAAHCARIIAVTGVAPVVYMNESTAGQQPWAKTRALGCALWVARYYANNGQPSGPEPSAGPWGQWIGWQYTSNGSLPGISAQVDLSRFDLTADQWRAYGTPHHQEDDVQLNDMIPIGVAADGTAVSVTYGEILRGGYQAYLGMYEGGVSTPGKQSLFEIVGDIQATIKSAQDPEALAEAVVSKMGADFAGKVIDALGARINAVQPS